MENNTVLVTFSRQGQRDGVQLSKDLEYRVRVDNGAPSTFRSPWDQARLLEIIEVLRNEGVQTPTRQYLEEIGKELGEALHEVAGLQGYLSRGNVTIHLQLDYPELARLPWELCAAKEFPHRHLLEEGIQFVRQVPCKRQDRPAAWPSGRNESLRLLYLWGEGKAGSVPHNAHLQELGKVCLENGIKLEPLELTSIDALTEKCRHEKFHFVHFLGHGAIDENNEWGLAISDDEITRKKQVVTGKQLALALTAGGSTPAMVSLASCDSANNRDNSFGSVAFEMHASGIPFVHASQFRLRKTVSVETVRALYQGVLGGNEPLGVVHDIKRQLAPRANEGWVNEVVYCRYRQEALEDLFVIVRQQSALRRAREISKNQFDDEESIQAGLKVLNREQDALKLLVNRLRKMKPGNRAAIAETYGLLGSLERRMMEIRNSSSYEELHKAREYYESGFKADANSHYCGINVIHLSLQMKEDAEAAKWITMVGEIAANQGQTDLWAWATVGDVNVYSGNTKGAVESYREFVKGVERTGRDSETICNDLKSSLKPLKSISELFEERPEIHTAAIAAIKVLESAIARNS